MDNFVLVLAHNDIKLVLKNLAQYSVTPEVLVGLFQHPGLTIESEDLDSEVPLLEGSESSAEVLVSNLLVEV